MCKTQYMGGTIIVQKISPNLKKINKCISCHTTRPHTQSSTCQTGHHAHRLQLNHNHHPITHFIYRSFNYLPLCYQYISSFCIFPILSSFLFISCCFSSIVKMTVSDKIILQTHTGNGESVWILLNK